MKAAGKWVVWAGAIVIVAPLISLLIAYLVAGLFGCPLNEASVQECSVFGADLGGLLYQMSVAGWYLFLSLPLGLVVIIVGAILQSAGRRRT